MDKEKYLRSVKRRLNLPKDIRCRVMADFESDLESRLESGMTWEEVQSAFGTPRKAAAELNEQMKDYTYRKSPWRYFFAIGAIFSGCWVILYAILQKFGMLLDTLQWSFSPNEAASIGIIGGADGPTSIFVTGVTTTGPDWDLILMVLITLLCILAWLRLRRCRPQK